MPPEHQPQLLLCPVIYGRIQVILYISMAAFNHADHLCTYVQGLYIAL